MKLLRSYFMVVIACLLAIPTFNAHAVGESVTFNNFSASCDADGAKGKFDYTPVGFTGSGTINYNYTMPGISQPTIYFDSTLTIPGQVEYGNFIVHQTSNWTMRFTFIFEAPDASEAARITLNGFCDISTNTLTIIIGELVSDPTTLPLFNDGRENNNDAGQTVAVYCDVPNSGDLQVYAVYNQVGYLAFTITKAELAAGVQKPTSAYLIKQALGAQLWRLPSGDLHIRRGTYHFEWPKC